MFKKIGTHSGQFQADDVFACAMLKVLDPLCPIVRTRDQGILDECGIVVDVGGVYDHDKLRYDHHQVGRAGARPNGVLYSACGLVWRHYGVEICRKLGHAGCDPEAVAARVDRRLIQALDATDNGQRLFEGGVPAFEGVSQVTLSGVIAGFNPCSHESQRATVYDTQFQTAVSFATRILDNAITSECGVLLAEAAVKAALDAREDKRLLVLDAFLPWQETAVKDPDVVYTVFKDETGGTWMVQAVPPVLGSFDKRKPLPAAWAGLRDSEFSKAVGISDGVFCHPGAFICGARSKESALRIAQIALEAS